MNQPPSFLRESREGVLLAVKVTPRASRNEIGGAHGTELKIKVTAPPVDAAANAAVHELLVETLDCPRHAVQLVRGPTSRHKVFAIHGLALEEIARRLAG